MRERRNPRGARALLRLPASSSTSFALVPTFRPATSAYAQLAALDWTGLDWTGLDQSHASGFAAPLPQGLRAPKASTANRSGSAVLEINLVASNRPLKQALSIRDDAILAVP